MKRIIFVLLLCNYMYIMNAQKNVKIIFIVDCSSYKGNVPVIAQNIKIGGNFTDVGAPAVPNWNALGSPSFTQIANKIFSTTITFDSSGFGDTLKYKFIISTGDWGQCNSLTGNTQECISKDSNCWALYDDYRITKITKTAKTVAYFYNTCTIPNLGFLSNTNIEENAWAIFPNPTNGNMAINLGQSPINGAVQVVDQNGKIIYINTFQNTKIIQIPSANFKVGVYSVSIKNNNAIKNIRFVKLP